MEFGGTVGIVKGEGPWLELEIQLRVERDCDLEREAGTVAHPDASSCHVTRGRHFVLIRILFFVDGFVAGLLPATVLVERRPVSKLDGHNGYISNRSLRTGMQL